MIGIDVDAREVRVAGFDLSGLALAVARRPVRLMTPAAGAIEVDPAQFWQTTVRTIRHLADRIPDLGRRTVAVGVSGCLGGRYQAFGDAFEGSSTEVLAGIEHVPGLAEALEGFEPTLKQ